MTDKSVAVRETSVVEAGKERPVPLGRVPRIIMGCWGGVFGIAGVVGTFVPEALSGGVALLLVMGGAFGYVSASGQRLLQLNRDGFTLDASEERVAQLEAVISRTASNPEVPADVLEQIVETVHELVPTRGELERDFQFRIGLQLNQLGRRHSFTVAVEPSLTASNGAPLRPDFLLSTPDSKVQVPLELKAPPREVDDAVLNRYLRQVVTYRESCNSDKAILLINRQVPTAWRERASAKGVILLSATPAFDLDDRLLEALSAAGIATT